MNDHQIQDEGDHIAGGQRVAGPCRPMIADARRNAPAGTATATAAVDQRRRAGPPPRDRAAHQWGDDEITRAATIHRPATRRPRCAIRRAGR